MEKDANKVMEFAVKGMLPKAVIKLFPKGT